MPLNKILRGAVDVMAVGVVSDVAMKATKTKRRKGWL